MLPILRIGYSYEPKFHINKQAFSQQMVVE